MAKVIGVGGVFFKSKDPTALLKWYSEVVGMEQEPWGGVALRPQPMADHRGAATIFSPFKADTTYFEPSTNPFMINLAVDDLDGVLANCARHGVTPRVRFSSRTSSATSRFIASAAGRPSRICARCLSIAIIAAIVT